MKKTIIASLVVLAAMLAAVACGSGSYVPASATPTMGPTAVAEVNEGLATALANAKPLDPTAVAELNERLATAIASISGTPTPIGNPTRILHLPNTEWTEAGYRKMVSDLFHKEPDDSLLVCYSVTGLSGGEVITAFFRDEGIAVPPMTPDLIRAGEIVQEVCADILK